MTHSRAVFLMVLVTLMWSIAGVVTRHLQAAESFEVTFWRSAFTVLALSVALPAMRGAAWWRDVLRARWPLWASGVCWAAMFTAFMVAITLTKVANVLVTLAIAPLVTALFARVVLHHKLPHRTWVAMAVAGTGIAWMFGREMQLGGAALGGMAVALAVPLAAATNWTLLQHIAHGSGDPDEPAQDMLPAVWIGAVLSSLATLPPAWPLRASGHDLALLALLGVVQLAIPCLLAVWLARVLPGPEIALLALLEVVFGVAWAWLGAGEAPSRASLTGGTLVLAALIGNELLALQQRMRAVPR
ncbi:MAG TPA: DMT family transporter [Burkholderiaceae bacterium]|nr:DMT family transporter [Burkholderiaceae bacterium]HSC01649.1 DMT family transporter [Burkholderiaceae bacterium]